MSIKNKIISYLKQNLFPYIRKKTGVRSLTHVKNKYKRKWDKKIHNKSFSPEELENKLRKLGIEEGDTVCVHSSWDEFYNFSGNPEKVIEIFLNILGNEGTLMMPSYPLLRKENSVFSLKSTPTKAGLLPEVFRNYPGVKRSLDIHSVVALGKNAVLLTESHQFSKTSWDENSPYYILKAIKGKVINFGLGKYHVGTVMHCADSILSKELEYFKTFFTKKKELKIKKEDGEIFQKEYYTASEDFSFIFTEKYHSEYIKKYFDKTKYKIDKISNLNITLFDATYTIDRSIELARKGIVVYLSPDPKKFKF